MRKPTYEEELKMCKTICTAVVLLLFLTACAGNVEQGENPEAGEMTWQEQYDLGVRYLSEGNYAEAQIAFYAAIQIDPKEVRGYLGHAKACRGQFDTQDGRESTAIDDYEKALELDEFCAEAYAGLADIYFYIDELDRAKAVLEAGLEKLSGNEEHADGLIQIYLALGDYYIRQNDFEQALSILEEALTKVRDTGEIAAKIEEIKSGTIYDSNGLPRREPQYDDAGNIVGYRDIFYISDGDMLQQMINDHPANSVFVLNKKTYRMKNRLKLKDLENVEILGTEGSSLRITSGGEVVVEVGSCHDLTIRNLEIGHDDDVGYCDQGVLQAMDSNLSLIKCDIFGCGTVGVAVYGCTIAAQETVIHDCSYSVMWAYESEAEFSNCTFSGNGCQYPDFAGEDFVNPAEYALEGSGVVSFKKCDFTNNLNGQIVPASDADKFVFEECTFSGNGWDEN